METDTNDVKGIMEDRTSSIDEAETDGGEMYCYTVNQEDDDSQRSSPTLYSISQGEDTSDIINSTENNQKQNKDEDEKRTMTKYVSKGMFYRRTTTGAGCTPSKNAVGMLKEQFETQNIILGGTTRPDDLGNDTNKVGNLREMFEKQSQKISTPESPKSVGENDKDEIDLYRDSRSEVSEIQSQDSEPMDSPNTAASHSGHNPFRPALLRHLSHLKVTPVDIVPSRLEDMPSQEQLDELKDELYRHMDHLAVPPKTTNNQPVLDEDDDRVPIYV